jgi:hypothetical protein
MEESKERIIQAIKDANMWLEAGEGINLLYWFTPSTDEDHESYRIIKQIISE